MINSIIFLLSSIVFFLQGMGLPGIPLNAFTPWIAFNTLIRKECWKALALAAFSGVFIDLFSDHPFGVHACSYTLASFFLFRYRNRFLYREPVHFALFTTCISFIASLLHAFFLFLFDRRIAIPGEWILCSGFIVSLIDGIYALIWFSGPIYLWFKWCHVWGLFW